jgi:putative ABC transport system ATP-binding protein
MVTHDPRYARHAQRTVHLFDGRIVEEEEAARKQQETAELKQSGFDVA